MDERPFRVLFFILLVIVIISKSPLNFLSNSFIPPTLGGFSLVYVVSFAIYSIIIHFDWFKKKIYGNHIDRLKHFVYAKKNNMKKDFIYFLMISILISFYVDVFLVKLDGSTFEEILLDPLPAVIKVPITNSMEFYFNTREDTDEQNENVDPFSNFFSVVSPAMIVQITIPSTGAIIVFLLRQLRYAQLMESIKYPGIRLLFVFLIVMPIILIFDVLILINFDNDIIDEQPENSKIYDLQEFSSFGMRVLISSGFYFFIGVMWIFDWFLFSKLWDSYHAKNDELKSKK